MIDAVSWIISCDSKSDAKQQIANQIIYTITNQRAKQFSAQLKTKLVCNVLGAHFFVVQKHMHKSMYKQATNHKTL